MHVNTALLYLGFVGHVYTQFYRGASDNQLADLPSPDHCRLPEPPASGRFFSVHCYGVDDPSTECLNLPNTPVRPDWALTYICDEGFYLPQGLGFFDIWCRGGRWVPAPPTCQDRICEKPVQPANGSYTSHPLDCTEDCALGPHQRENSLLTLQCDPGFIPPHDTSALCVEGTWIKPGECSSLATEINNSINPYIRRQSCRLPEPPEHGTYFSANCYSADSSCLECAGIPGTRVEDSWTISVLCEEGFLPSNNQTYAHSKCISGQWTPPLPTCEVSLENRCRVPRAPQHGLFAVACSRAQCSDGPGTLVPPGYKLTLSCYEGYRPAEGYALSTCADGQWSPPPPTCADSSQSVLLTRDISDIQSQFAGCVLPQPPKNGFYTLFGQNCNSNRPEPKCLKNPGETVPHLQVLSIACDRGYQVGGQIGSTFLVSCDDGQWSHTFPECSMPCPQLRSRTVDMECYQGPKLVPCDSPMLLNTTVASKCKPNHATTDDPRDLVCLVNGQWSGSLPSCKPNCGLSKLNSYEIVPTVVNGNASALGYFPWHAGIYHQTKGTNRWENKCGGTLISPHIILTAAHCVTTDHGKKLKDDEVRVALGKYHRDWYTYEPDAIKRKIKDIQIQPNYLGQESLLDLDIAMMALEAPVTINSFVMPACVDYRLTQRMTKHMIGYLAGWGRTQDCSACGDGSDTLLYTNTSYLSFLDCYNAMQRIKRLPLSRLTSDKFCAGDGTLSVAQSGDSGGGVTFVFGGVHYVEGVVSVKISFPEAYSFSAFTNVSHHIAWIQKIASHFDTLIPLS